ncbi:MAG TPA: hypothetical protein PLT66_01540 [Bacillota bacterium]|nr:hypothetical protein [Bacillota bacterium]
MRMRERLYRFMYGRNGIDQFGKFISIAYLVLVLVNYFIGSLIFSGFILLLFAYWLFRILSKNTYKRQKENQVYLKAKTGFLNFFRQISNRFKNRKTNVYRKCPSCKATLKLPKLKGKHTVTCPKCRKQFEVKI